MISIPSRPRFLLCLVLLVSSFSSLAEEPEPKFELFDQPLEESKPGDLLASCEIRGIDRFLEQAGDVAGFFNPILTPEMLRPLLGGLLLSPELKDIDTTKPVQLHLSAVKNMDNPPDVLVRLPLKGDGLVDQLKRTMKVKALDDDIIHYQPKGGGGRDGIGLPGFPALPTINTMEWFGTRDGDLLTLATTKKFLTEFLAHDVTGPKAPGAAAVRLHMRPVRIAMRASMEESARENRKMWKRMAGGIDNNNDDGFGGFFGGEMPDNPYEASEKMAKATFTMVHALENLEFGLQAQNDLLTLCTLAKPTADSLFAKTVGQMGIPSEGIRRAVPHSEDFAYVANWATMSELSESMIGLFENVMADALVMQAVFDGEDEEEANKQIEAAQKEMREAQKATIDAIDEDVAMTFSLREEKTDSLMLSALKDPAKYMDYINSKVVEKEDPDAITTQYLKLGKREKAGCNIRKMKTITPPIFGDIADVPFGFDTVEMTTHADGTLVMASTPAQMDKALSALGGEGLPFEKRGLFAKRFAELKQVPSSMLVVDLIALMHAGMALQAHQGAFDNFNPMKGLPRNGTRLTGCSMKFGGQYLRLDRTGYTDIMTLVQFFQGMQRNTEEYFRKMMEEDGGGFGFENFEGFE